MNRLTPAPGGDPIVSRLDDLASSLEALASLLRRLESRGVTLRLEDDASGPLSEPEARAMVRGVLLAADFQARVTAMRLKGQVAATRGQGLFPPGRPRTIDREQLAALRASGLGAPAIAARLGIARASVYRTLKEIEAPETRRLKAATSDLQAASPNCSAARRA
ncbi:MAG: recombinase family protein [Proteobacteria bacterium]|nr:recombinase family protein [Pseudomonadota bacterium]